MTSLKSFIVEEHIIGGLGVLVFARSEAEAKNLGCRYIIKETLCDRDEIAVIEITKPPQHLIDCADAEKLSQNRPHLVIDVPGCCECEYWGVNIIPNKDGYCEECYSKTLAAKTA